MKKKDCILALACAMLFVGSGYAMEEVIKRRFIEEYRGDNTLLDSLDKSLYKAFVSAFKRGNLTRLKKIVSSIEPKLIHFERGLLNYAVCSKEINIIKYLLKQDGVDWNLISLEAVAELDNEEISRILFIRDLINLEDDCDFDTFQEQEPPLKKDDHDFEPETKWTSVGGCKPHSQLLRKRRPRSLPVY